MSSAPVVTFRLKIRLTASSLNAVSIIQKSKQLCLILSFSQIKIQLVSALSDHGVVKSRMNALHSVSLAAIVLGMTAATETERDVGMSAFTSLTETMRNLTAMAFASRRVKNVTWSVLPSADLLASNVALVLKQNVSPRQISSLIEESELAKRMENVSTTLRLVGTIVGQDTSSVERSVAKSQNTGCATGSVLKIMCNAMDCVLRKEKYVDKSTASHQTHRTPTPQLTTRSAMDSARR